VTVVFYIAAAIALASTAAVVFTGSPVRALRWLALSLLASAVLAYAVAAPLAAAVAFALHLAAMLLAYRMPAGRATVARERRWRVPRVWVVPVMLMTIVLLELMYVLAVNVGAGALHTTVSAADLAAALMGPYAVTAVLALLLGGTALISGLHLVRRAPGREPGDG
jgi:NADH-quinone oxidoreductase subunit J